MKKFNYLLKGLVIFILGFSVLKAQNTSNWYFNINGHAVDHTAARGWGDGFLDYDDYSIFPPLTKFSAVKFLWNSSLAADATISFGEIDNKRLILEDRFFINAGLGLRYHPNKYKWFDPYGRIGVNYHMYDYSDLDFTNGIEVAPGTGREVPGQENDILIGDVQGDKGYLGVATGLGINFWVNQRIGLNIASDYNWMVTGNSDYFNFFQHSLGVAFRFAGEKDRDQDGIIDKEDDCPDTYGITSTLQGCNGCPDSDGDGLCDGIDQCPTEVGSVEDNGCPKAEFIDYGVCGKDGKDSDGDGICDKDDDCVNIPGIASSKPGCNGCPDTDGDNVCDNQDPCPEDPKDECVVFDKIGNFRNVLFEYDSDVIIPESQADLVEAATILASEAYSDKYWLVEGHTDSRGSDSYNKKLSQKRADAIKNYLVNKGVKADHIKAIGYGEEYPVRPNDSEEGMQQNRRVEFEPANADFKPVALKVDDKRAAKVLNRLAAKVYFYTGKATLLETSKLNLDKMVAYLNQSNKSWEIGGHTDNVGDAEANQKLSQDRAESVKEYLVDKGVSPSKLTVKGYGESQPKDTNDTKNGRANNRRIEFK